MKAGWKFALAFLVGIAGLPLLASAGHGRHHHGGYGHGGGYGYGGGYGGGCGCGAPVQYAPPVHAQYGEPTPALAQSNAGYQSFSYSPTPAAEANVAPAAAPVMASQGYYQSAPMYAPNYSSGYRGYSNNRREARAFNNAANRSLGNNDYGIGR